MNVVHPTLQSRVLFSPQFHHCASKRFCCSLIIACPLRRVREHLAIKIPNQALPIRICHCPHCPNDNPESATLPHGTRVRGEGTLEVDLARARERGSQGGECCAAVRLCPGGRRQRSIRRGERWVGISAGERELDPAREEGERRSGGRGEGDEGQEGFAVDLDHAPAPAGRFYSYVSRLAVPARSAGYC
jgi:hypothetical protein